MAEIPTPSGRPDVAFPVPGDAPRTPISPGNLTGVFSTEEMSMDAARLKPPGVPVKKA